MGSYYAGMKNNSYNTSLHHSGIIGMKWGIRRFQNEDGTWTDLGKLRYENWAAKRLYGGDWDKKEAAESRYRETQAKTIAEREAKAAKSRAEYEKKLAAENAEKARKKAEAEEQQRRLNEAVDAITNAASSAVYPATKKKLASIAQKLAAGKITIEEAMQLAQEALAKDAEKAQKAAAAEARRRAAAQQKAQKNQDNKLRMHATGHLVSLARKGGGRRR